MKYPGLAHLLRAARKKRGLSQEALRHLLEQELVDISGTGNISKWENGNTRPRQDTVEALAEVLSLPRSELLKAAGYMLETYVNKDEAQLSNTRQGHFDSLLNVADRWCDRSTFPQPVFMCNLGPRGLTDLSCVLTDTHYRPARGSFRSVLVEGRYGLEDDMLFQCLQEHLRGHAIGKDSAEWLRLAGELKTACTTLFDGMKKKASRGIASAYGSLYDKECLRVRAKWGAYIDALEPDLGELYHRAKECSQPVAVVGAKVVVYSPDNRVLSAIDLHSRSMRDTLKTVLGLGSVSTFRPNRYPALSIHADNYAKSAYQYAVGQDFLQNDAAASQHINFWYGGKLDHHTTRSGWNSSDWPYRLWFGDALLAEFNDAASEAAVTLQKHHKALVARYASSAEVAHIGELANQLGETGQRMTDDITLLRQKAALPGSCRACPGT